MAIVLYRRGNTHTIRGVDCELKRVEPAYFNGTPEKGWFMSPEKAYEENDNGMRKEREEEQAEEVEVIENVVQSGVYTTEEKVLNFNEMSNQKIREQAQKANIKNWKKARIETLKEKLRA